MKRVRVITSTDPVSLYKAELTGGLYFSRIRAFYCFFVCFIFRFSINCILLSVFLVEVFLVSWQLQHDDINQFFCRRQRVSKQLSQSRLSRNCAALKLKILTSSTELYADVRWSSPQIKADVSNDLRLFFLLFESNSITSFRESRGFQSSACIVTRFFLRSTHIFF